VAPRPKPAAASDSPNGKPKKKKKQAAGDGVAVKLYDIHADPAEKNNLAPERPEDVKRMRAELEAWQRSVRASYDGADFASAKP
jgi:hypothetical protein